MVLISILQNKDASKNQFNAQGNVLKNTSFTGWHQKLRKKWLCIGEKEWLPLFIHMYIFQILHAEIFPGYSCAKC